MSAVPGRWRGALDRALDRLWSWRCLGCARPGRERLCEACLEEWAPWRGIVRCGRCARALPEARPCADCLGTDFAFEGVYALSPYHGLARRALGALKYGRAPALGTRLGRLLAERGELPEAPWRVVPVPSGYRRRLARGYHPAYRLARALAAARGWAYRPVLWRRPFVAPQQGRGAEGRRRNAEGAYFLAPGHGLAGRHVLLVDDVMTTGTTAHAIARLCLDAGAASVAVAVVARA